MSLEPRVSLSPRNQFESEYDTSNPTAISIKGALFVYGASTYSLKRYGPNPYSLETLHDNDSLLIANNPVDVSDSANLTSFYDYARRCSVNINFSGRNIPTNRQYLFIFRLRAVENTNWSVPTVQFYMGLDFIEQRKLLLGEDDDIAILIDAPTSAGLRNITARLATDGSYSTGFLFKGVDIYLL